MFAPSSSTLIVAGGTTAAQVRELAERHLARIPGREQPLAELRSAHGRPEKRVRGLLTPGSVALVVQTFQAPSAASRDALSFGVLSVVAAELFSSRLNRALRSQEAFTYHVAARHEARAHDGWWLLESAGEPSLRTPNKRPCSSRISCSAHHATRRSMCAGTSRVTRASWLT